MPLQRLPRLESQLQQAASIMNNEQRLGYSPTATYYGPHNRATKPLPSALIDTDTGAITMQDMSDTPSATLHDQTTKCTIQNYLLDNQHSSLTQAQSLISQEVTGYEMLSNKQGE
jgi:hypothetical protein